MALSQRSPMAATISATVNSQASWWTSTAQLASDEISTHRAPGRSLVTTTRLVPLGFMVFQLSCAICKCSHVRGWIGGWKVYSGTLRSLSSGQHRLDKIGAGLSERPYKRIDKFTVGLHTASRHPEPLRKRRPLHHRVRKIGERLRLGPRL